MRCASCAALALAVLTGCGGESSSERIRKDASASATPVPDVRADDDGDGDTIPLDLYRVRVRKLCSTASVRTDARLAPLRADVRENPTLARRMKLNAAAVELTEPLFEEMASLPPPKGHEHQVRQLNRLGAATIRYLERAAKAYEAGDVRTAKRAISVNQTAALAYAKAAERLGLDQCGVEPTYPGG